ncbi:MAG: TOBE domain-containing protein, partial [Proteobacteria bacterium]|nr:TOBE domain-containing protein [Pseudomonadota bacterium]
KPGDNQVCGRVEEFIYLGDHIRVRLAVAGNHEFVVKVSNTQQRTSLSVGDQVQLCWAADDCRALDTLQDPSITS